MSNLGSKKLCSIKIEDIFIDTCSIPIGKVQSSFFVVYILETSSFSKRNMSFFLSDKKDLCILLNQLCPSFCRGYSPK